MHADGCIGRSAGIGSPCLVSFFLFRLVQSPVFLFSLFSWSWSFSASSRHLRPVGFFSAATGALVIQEKDERDDGLQLSDPGRQDGDKTKKKRDRGVCGKKNGKETVHLISWTIGTIKMASFMRRR